MYLRGSRGEPISGRGGLIWQEGRADQGRGACALGQGVSTQGLSQPGVRGAPALGRWKTRRGGERLSTRGCGCVNQGRGGEPTGNGACSQRGRGLSAWVRGAPPRGDSPRQLSSRPRGYDSVWSLAWGYAFVSVGSCHTSLWGIWGHWTRISRLVRSFPVTSFS